ncbi:hypothetical protein MKW92_042816 [Papaver armeniacum]|nr:hypothetical protein MKW92_042816 [Papaver armeniacum]
MKRENKALKDILLADAGRLNIHGEDVEGYAYYYEKISGLFSSLYAWVFRSITTL